MFDYFDYFKSMPLLHTVEFFTKAGYPFTYMPTGVPLSRGLYIFGAIGGFLVYLLLFVTGVVIGARVLSVSLVRRGLPKLRSDSIAVIAIITGYPFFFCLQRGNPEILLAFGLAAGTSAYWMGKPGLAAVLWGIFGSVKIYPLLMLAVFLNRRDFRCFLIGLATTCAATIAALAYMGPTIWIAIWGMRLSIKTFVSMYALRYDPWIGYDHSLFALLKIALQPWHPNLNVLLTAYFLVAGSVATGVYFLRVRKLPFANQLLFLTCMSILLPPTSFDYTLLQLYAPLAVFIMLALDRTADGLTPIFIVFGLLLAPTQFFVIHGVSYTGQFKSLLLIALAALSCRATRRHSVAEFVRDRLEPDAAHPINT